jgi:N-acetylmuramoyl-L-alanine amidase
VSGSGRKVDVIKKIILALGMSLFLFSLSSFADSVILRGFYVQNTPQDMNIIFNLSSSTQYRYFMLHNPTRFVVDLRNTKTYQQLHLPMNNAPFTVFNYATHRDGVFRMVFNLNSLSAMTASVHALSADQLHQARLEITFPKKVKIIQPAKQVTAFSSFNSVLAHNVFLPHKTAPKTQPKLAMATPKPILVDNDDASKKHRNVIIVVDPGHGGKDPGATGPGGTHEKTIVLAIGKKLQKWIDAQPGYTAMLTRTGDYYLTLRQRLRIARKDKADMFIAIHADIWRNTTAGGVSVFALSEKGATSEAARWLAARENASELMGGVHLNDKSHMLKSVLINLSQAATIRTSLEIGNDLLKTIKPMARLHHDRVEQAAFVVLKSPDIPSLLVETGFLSNPNEERKLKNPAYQNKLAHAIQEGICNYFDSHPPRGTWLSYWKKHPDQRRG